MCPRFVLTKSSSKSFRKLDVTPVQHIFFSKKGRRVFSGRMDVTCGSRLQADLCSQRTVRVFPKSHPCLNSGHIHGQVSGGFPSGHRSYTFWYKNDAARRHTRSTHRALKTCAGTYHLRVLAPALVLARLHVANLSSTGSRAAACTSCYISKVVIAD